MEQVKITGPDDPSIPAALLEKTKAVNDAMEALLLPHLVPINETDAAARSEQVSLLATTLCGLVGFTTNYFIKAGMDEPLKHIAQICQCGVNDAMKHVLTSALSKIMKEESPAKAEGA